MAVSGPGRDPGLAGMQHFTYEPSDDGYQEVQLFRGIHPMMSERLHLWRLKNFKIERLPSVEDIYLLHAVANDNPKDERLFAVAEVRDLTPVRDHGWPNRAIAAPGAHVRRSGRRHPAVPVEARRRARGCTGTGSSFMCGRRSLSSRTK